MTITQVSVTSRGAQDQLTLAAKGQVSDRFTKAIEQLGNSNVDVRLGGIYVIDRIATDSEDYRPTLAAVLSAFVRRNAARPLDQEGNYNSGPENLSLDARKPDIQAAITVLGQDKMPGSKLNGTDIQGVDLSNTNISEDDFTHADMASANFRHARDVGGEKAANLSFAYLGQATF